jgi:hypothetical protein
MCDKLFTVLACDLSGAYDELFEAVEYLPDEVELVSTVPTGDGFYLYSFTPVKHTYTVTYTI